MQEAAGIEASVLSADSVSKSFGTVPVLVQRKLSTSAPAKFMR
jgi:hypothetical protein